MTLPTISRGEIPFVWPINWLGLHREYTVPGEMEIIAGLLREVEAKRVLEIGCRDGRTARVLLHNVSALTDYWGVDVTSSYQPGLAHQRAEMVQIPGVLAAADPRFRIIVRARGSLDIDPNDLNLDPFDACFIDGDHSEAVVMHDSHLARALVRSGGLIIWHDYNQSDRVDVTKVLDQLHREGWPLKRIESTWLAFMRVDR